MTTSGKAVRCSCGHQMRCMLPWSFQRLLLQVLWRQQPPAAQEQPAAEDLVQYGQSELNLDEHTCLGLQPEAADAVAAANRSAITAKVIEAAGHQPQEDYPQQVMSGNPASDC